MINRHVRSNAPAPRDVISYNSKYFPNFHICNSDSNLKPKPWIGIAARQTTFRAVARLIWIVLRAPSLSLLPCSSLFLIPRVFVFRHERVRARRGVVPARRSSSPVIGDSVSLLDRSRNRPTGRERYNAAMATHAAPTIYKPARTISSCVYNRGGRSDAAWNGRRRKWDRSRREIGSSSPEADSRETVK